MATFNGNWLVLTVLVVHALSATSYVESAGASKDMETCVKQLDEACGKEILLRVFFNDGNPSADCCMQLVEMGKPCHDKLVKATVSSPQYRKNSKAILERSQRTWSECLFEAKSSSPHITSCPPTSDVDCGKEIFSRIFRSEGELSNGCCGVLVQIGKDCHDRLVKGQINSGKLGSNKTAILDASAAVWNWCSYLGPSLPSLKACEAKIDNKCGKEIGLGIFYGKGQVTKQCCAKLVKMGPECHDRWVKTNLAKPEFQKSSIAIIDRSTKIWKKCVSYV